MKEFNTAEQGTKDAVEDYETGWLDCGMSVSEQVMKEHVRVMVGGTEEYCAAYAAKAKELVRSK